MKKTFLNPKNIRLKDFIEALPERFETDGEYVYGGRRNLIKRFVAPDGTRLIVKRFKRPGFFNDIVYSTGLRKPKGRRAYDYPPVLLSHGIRTPEAVAYIEFRRCGLLQLSYLFTVECPYGHLMYEAGKMPEGTYEGLAVALARFAALMHEERILHLDFSPGNILWEKDGDDYRFSLVDINRMHFGNVDIVQGCRNFRRLWGSRQFFIILAREYGRRRNLNPDECERLTLKFRAQFWHHYNRIDDVDYKYED
jgi:serine/threonine protein kinase